MYHDLKEVYWWNNMKRDVVNFVAKCPNCQQVKAKHQGPGGLLQSIEILMRKWEMIDMDFVMAPFEALYGRRCRYPIWWFEVGEAEPLGSNLVHHAMEKVKVIQERMKTTQSRQKSYTDVHRRELEFQVDDWVFLKVSPIKGVIRFEKKGKLSPRTIEVNEELSYEEIPVAILDRQVRKLRTKEIASVKVLWWN
ncbi:uncharacterized protein [Nicotiana sylvestris]|uniref:uncharacterized protein n=1 Tax=Nicotiana sylvestris TaxID=4096 RepID=UPI00388C9BEE